MPHEAFPAVSLIIESIYVLYLLGATVKKKTIFFVTGQLLVAHYLLEMRE